MLSPANLKGADTSAGWLLFWTLFALEFTAGFIYGFAAARGVRLSESLLLTVLLITLLHGIIWLVALFWVARHSRGYCESVAVWLWLMLIYQSFALALYLSSRPSPDAELWRTYA